MNTATYIIFGNYFDFRGGYFETKSVSTMKYTY